MEKSIKISIVTPSYNQGAFIEDAIQSVVDQDYPNFEHIIIDGGSKDNTVEILKKYPHLNWTSEADKGQSDGLNKGFLKASGDWILWLNADDILFKGAINSYLQAAQKHLNCNVFYGNVIFFNNEKKIIKKQYFLQFKKIFTVLEINTPPTTGTFFQARLLKNNLLDVSYHYMMDVEWFCRRSIKMYVHVINRFMVGFRVSGSNKTSDQILFGKINNQQILEINKLRSNYFPFFFKMFPVKFYDKLFFFARCYYKFYYLFLKTLNVPKFFFNKKNRIPEVKLSYLSKI